VSFIISLNPKDKILRKFIFNFSQSIKFNFAEMSVFDNLHFSKSENSVSVKNYEGILKIFDCLKKFLK
jgi:hypothetical protein